MIASSGIGTQVQNVLRSFLVQGRAPVLLGDPFLIERLLPDYPGEIREWRSRIYSPGEQWSCPAIASPDFIHFPHYNAAVKELRRAFVVVHDLIHLQSPEFRSPLYRIYARFLLDQISRRALHIITVSEATRKTLIEYFPAAEPKTTTIYNGINHSLFKPAEKKSIVRFQKKNQLPLEYLLVTGIGKAHKNLDRLLRALQPLWKQKCAPPLVVAGAGVRLPEYASGILSPVEEAENVIQLGFLPEKELPLLYSGCQLFIQPSFLEGFGFPLAEALACGAVCVAGNRTSLPEVGGDAVHYFNPFSIEEIQAAIVQALTSSDLRRRLRGRARKQASRFSWESHVAKLDEIYQSYGLNFS
ncbi:MAG: glycosyltransferase family 4 protein [Spirochaetales bacterium]|nr:glycosyltransferase family 4 protein [Spirochaetales bacterium]